MKWYKKYREQKLIQLLDIRRLKIISVKELRFEDGVNFREQEKIIMASLGMKPKRPRWDKRLGRFLKPQYLHNIKKKYGSESYEKIIKIINGVPPTGQLINTNSWEFSK